MKNIRLNMHGEEKNLYKETEPRIEINDDKESKYCLVWYEMLETYPVEFRNKCYLKFMS